MSMENIKPAPEFLMSEYSEAMNEKGRAFDGDDRFSEAEFLSEGGCKRLFVLTDHWAGRKIVKAVPKNESPETVEKFIYESQILSSLEHPNILPAYDVGSDEGSPFILMKLMEGDNLKDFLAYEPPLSLKLKIFEKICDAIAYCHKSEIVHLDIKPENIQVSPTFEVTVCDWGSAKKFSDLEKNELVSTPGYIAPESFEGKLSHSCDIYALGAIFYEMLTSKRLFSGKNAAAVLKLNKAGETDLSLVKDPSLRAVCRKALETDPEKRFHSVEEFLERLNLYYQKFPVPEENASPFRRCDLLVKRRPVAVGMFTILLTLTSVISIIFAMTFNRQKNRAENLMHQYQEERDKAERLMHQYQEERDRRVSLSLENSDMLHNQAWQAYKEGMLDEAGNLLSLSVSATGYDKRKKELEGLIHLLKFNVDQARESFAKGGVENSYKVYYTLLPNKEKLLQLSTKELTDLVMKIRKTDSYFYHSFIGSVFTLKEFSDRKREDFINAVCKALGFSGTVKVEDYGKTVTVSGNASNFPTYILRAMRLKKLVFKNCRSMPNEIRTKELNDCVELEELDFRGTAFSHLYLLKNNSIKRLYLSSRTYDRIDHLQSMPLEEIFMVNVKIKSLSPLLQIRTLKAVSISEAMKSLPGYKELSEKISVKIEK